MIIGLVINNKFITTTKTLSNFSNHKNEPPNINDKTIQGTITGISIQYLSQ